MESNKALSQLVPGNCIEGYYILKTAAQKTSSTGKPFLTGQLADRSGTIDYKIWDYSGAVGASNEGEIVWVHGTVSEYRGARQLTIDNIRIEEPEDASVVDQLVPTAPINTEAAYAKILEYVASISDPDYRKICEVLLSRNEKAFRTIPAAKSVHHSFLNGLLMHTGTMLCIASFMAKVYADTVDRSLLMAGTLLHDFGKQQEFCFSKLGLVTDYSVKGHLLGHLVMGAQAVSETARELGISEEKSVLLQHMILSHHGEPEFGAAVKPVCAESELLYWIDSVDSRMEIYRETFSDMEPDTMSASIFALGRKIYFHTKSDDMNR